MVARISARAAPVSDQRDRNAVQLAGDNAVVLEPGVAGLGKVAENHHVAPLHQEYAELPKIAPDPAKPFARMTETGQAETEGERFALDEG